MWYLIVSIPDLCTFTYFKSLLRQGLSEPDFYGDLVYKLKKIVGSNNFSAQFIKITSHYKKIGYNINGLQQTACSVVNPIMVGNFTFFFFFFFFFAGYQPVKDTFSADDKNIP